MLIKAIVAYTFQKTPDAILNTLKETKEYELLDSDGYRDSFHDNVESAIARVKYDVEDALGLSGGIALGAVEVITEE